MIVFDIKIYGLTLLNHKPGTMQLSGDTITISSSEIETDIVIEMDDIREVGTNSFVWFIKTYSSKQRVSFEIPNGRYNRLFTIFLDKLGVSGFWGSGRSAKFLGYPSYKNRPFEALLGFWRHE